MYVFVYLYPYLYLDVCLVYVYSLSLARTHSSSLPLPLSRYTEDIFIIAKVDDASFSEASFKCLPPDSGQLADSQWKDGQEHDCKVSLSRMIVR